MSAFEEDKKRIEEEHTLLPTNGDIRAELMMSLRKDRDEEVQAEIRRMHRETLVLEKEILGNVEKEKLRLKEASELEKSELGGRLKVLMSELTDLMVEKEGFERRVSDMTNVEEGRRKEIDNLREMLELDDERINGRRNALICREKVKQQEILSRQGKLKETIRQREESIQSLKLRNDLQRKQGKDKLENLQKAQEVELKDLDGEVKESIFKRDADIQNRQDDIAGEEARISKFEKLILQYKRSEKRSVCNHQTSADGKGVTSTTRSLRK